MELQDMSEKLGEMAEVDLDYPFRVFQLAMDKSGITNEMREEILSAITDEIRAFDANPLEWAKTAYNL